MIVTATKDRPATLVTLECTPVDIAVSVNREGAGVYSPAVLHPWAIHRTAVLNDRRGDTRGWDDIGVVELVTDTGMLPNRLPTPDDAVRRLTSH